jgi:hypothetical protein
MTSKLARAPLDFLKTHRSGMASPDVNSTHNEPAQIMLAAQLASVSSVMYCAYTAPFHGCLANRQSHRDEYRNPHSLLSTTLAA